MRLYTLNEVADMLRISPWTLRSWIRDGRIAYVKVGRNIRFEESVIEKLLQRVRPTAPDELRVGESKQE